MLPLFACLPALEELDLCTPLGPTPSCAVFVCSSGCFDGLLSLLRKRPRTALRQDVESRGGWRTFNAVLTEVHLTRLRRLASYLPVGTVVYWSMVSDDSTSPPRFRRADEATIPVVPCFTGRVTLDPAGEQVLELCQDEFDDDEDDDDACYREGDWRDEDGQDEVCRLGRCYGCQSRGRQTLWTLDPRLAIGDFSTEEMTSARKRVASEAAERATHGV